MKQVSKENWVKSLSLCQKGKHKLRVNKMGVTWCVRCGLLSNTPNAENLQEDDKITII
jgi:hypothetical protein